MEVIETIGGRARRLQRERREAQGQTTPSSTPSSSQTRTTTDVVTDKSGREIIRETVITGDEMIVTDRDKISGEVLSKRVIRGDSDVRTLEETRFETTNTPSRIVEEPRSPVLVAPTSTPSPSRTIGLSSEELVSRTITGIQREKELLLEPRITKGSSPSFSTSLRIEGQKRGGVVGFGLDLAGATGELGSDIGRGAKELVSSPVRSFATKVVDREEAFPFFLAPSVSLPSGGAPVKPRSPKDVFRGFEEGAGRIGPELRSDPVKGGVLIAAEIATSFIPITSISRGVSKIKPVAPTTTTFNGFKGTGVPFKLEVPKADVVVRTKDELRVLSVSPGQVDLTGKPALSPEQVFRRQDFIPTEIEGKLVWLAPNDPRIRRTSAFDTSQKPLQTFGASDPVILKEVSTGKTLIKEAGLVEDFLSTETGFRVVGRPTKTTVTITSSAKPGVQKSLVTDTGFAFATPFPVVISRRSPSPLQQTFSSQVLRSTPSVNIGREASSNIIRKTPINSVARSVSKGLVQRLSLTGLTTASTSLSAQSLGFGTSQISSPLTNNKLRSSSITSTASISSSLLGLSSTGLGKTTPIVSTSSMISFPSPSRTPAPKPRTPLPIKLPTPNFNIQPGFSSNSPSIKVGERGFGSIKTAGVGKDFIVAPGRTTPGKVRLLRKGGTFKIK